MWAGLALLVPWVPLYIPIGTQKILSLLNRKLFHVTFHSRKCNRNDQISFISNLLTSGKYLARAIKCLDISRLLLPVHVAFVLCFTVADQ